MRKAALSFPGGSTGGPDAMRPQHLKDLIEFGDSSIEILSALTTFINMVISGRCPLTVIPDLVGGRLIALNMKDGGVRPDAVGYTLRFLAPNVAPVLDFSK